MDGSAGAGGFYDAGARRFAERTAGESAADDVAGNAAAAHDERCADAARDAADSGHDECPAADASHDAQCAATSAGLRAQGSRTRGAATDAAGSSPAATTSALANTGATYPVAPTVGVGAAAIALGAGALTAAHALRKRQESAPEA